jgi:hypothetical protein
MTPARLSGSVRVSLAMTLGLSVGLTAAPAAQACSCLGHSASLAWPRATSEVPLDGTLILVVSRTDGLSYRLSDDNGKEVTLETVRVLASPDRLCAGHYVFLRPAEDLAPQTRYTLSARFSGVDPSAASTPAHSLTTGTDRRTSLPPPEVNLWLFAQHFSGQRLLQVFASTPAPEPVFVVAQGERGKRLLALGPLAFEQPTSAPLGDVPCAELELVDVNGQTLANERLCQPQKCDWPALLVVDSCELNRGGDDWDRWQARPDGCPSSAGVDGGLGVADARPLEMRNPDSAEPTSVDPGPTTGDAAADKSGIALARRGCSVSAAGGTPPGPGTLILVLLGALRRLGTGAGGSSRIPRRSSGHTPRAMPPAGSEEYRTHDIAVQRASAATAVAAPSQGSGPVNL